jgi:hypothetical protein
VLSLRGRERDRDRDRERERERERTDRDHDREGADRDRDTDNLTFRFDASPPDAWELLESLTPAGVPSPRRDEVLDWIETSPTLPPVQPDDAPVLVDVDAEPPTVLERASPPPVVPVRSPSPDESSRAWLAEYASSSQVLGRRRRADSGLARLRLRHPEHGRDTRRDAVVVDTPNWFETIAWSDAAWRGSASGSGSGSGAGPGAGAEVEAEAEGAAQSERPAERRPLPPGIRLDRGMTRTLSLSAVGHGDGGDSDGASAGASASASGTASATAVHERDIAPLPRRGVPRSHTPL